MHQQIDHADPRFWFRVLRVIVSGIVVVAIISTALATDRVLNWQHVVLITVGLIPMYFQEISEFRLSVSGTEIHIKKLEDRIDEINLNTEDVYAAGSDDTLRLPDDAELPSGESLGDVEREVMQAFRDSRFRFRSIGGIANQLIKDRASVETAVQTLETNNLIRKTRSSDKNLWTLTAQGLAMTNPDSDQEVT